MQPHSHHQHGNIPPHMNQGQNHPHHAFNQQQPHNSAQQPYMYGQTPAPGQQGQFVNYYTPGQHSAPPANSGQYSFPSQGQRFTQQYSEQPMYHNQQQLLHSSNPHQQQHMKQMQHQVPSSMPHGMHQQPNPSQNTPYNPNMMYSHGRMQQSATRQQPGGQTPHMSHQIKYQHQQQGMPQPGMPQPGMSQQGMPQQGMPQPGMPQPGMPQQGMQPYNFPNQGSLPSNGQQHMVSYTHPQHTTQDQYASSQMYQQPQYHQQGQQNQAGYKNLMDYPQQVSTINTKRAKSTKGQSQAASMGGSGMMPQTQNAYAQQQQMYPPQQTPYISHPGMSQQQSHMNHNIPYQQQQKQLAQQFPQQQQGYSNQQNYTSGHPLSYQQQHQQLPGQMPSAQMPPQQIPQQQMQSHQILPHTQLQSQQIPATSKKPKASKKQPPATVDLTAPSYPQSVVTSQPQAVHQSVTHIQQQLPPPVKSTAAPVVNPQSQLKAAHITHPNLSQIHMPVHNSIPPVLTPTVGQKHGFVDDPKGSMAPSLKQARTTEPVAMNPPISTTTIPNTNPNSDVSTLKAKSISQNSLSTTATTVSVASTLSTSQSNPAISSSKIEEPGESYPPYSHFYSCIRLLLHLLCTISKENKFPENLESLNVSEFNSVTDAWLKVKTPTPLKHYCLPNTSIGELDISTTSSFNAYAKTVQNIFKKLLVLLEQNNYIKLVNNTVKLEPGAETKNLASNLIQFCDYSLCSIREIDEKCQHLLFRYSKLSPSSSTLPTDTSLFSDASVNSYGLLDFAADTVILTEVQTSNPENSAPTTYPSSFPSSLKDSMEEAVKLYPVSNFYETLCKTYEHVLTLPLPNIVPPMRVPASSNLNEEINNSVTVFSRMMQWPSASDTPFLGVANIS